MFDAEFWVAASFFIFIGILVYVGVHKKIAEALDHRRDRIKAELDEARRLREEAQALLAHYRQKQKEAEGEAAAILTGAKADAERMTLEAEAESQALADVRAAAADAAVTAAERILKDTAKGNLADDLLASGIEDVKNKLN